MMARYVDSHIHLDAYKEEERQLILTELKHYNVAYVIAVSMNMASCLDNQALHRAHPDLVKPAYGFHPEQPVLPKQELEHMLDWIRKHRHEAVAIGEVGLPYFKRKEAEAKGEPFDLEPYIELLDTFIALAAELDKPLNLHAIYEDADIVCYLLQKHRIKRAHFHWFKGSAQTIERIIRLGYHISFTPDLVYDPEIQQVAELVPLEHIMVETDGNWQHEGPYADQMTHPRMVADAVAKIAAMKGVSVEDAKRIIWQTTEAFYHPS